MDRSVFTLLLLLFFNYAYAATDQTTFTVSATVVNDCAVSATNMAFGDYDPDVGTASATSTITATCTNSTPYSMALNEGAGSGATTTTRKMTCTSGDCNAGTDVLNYSLYQDVSHATLWGEGANMQSGTGNGLAQNWTVYGQINSGQTVTAGNYSDTITAVLTY